MLKPTIAIIGYGDFTKLMIKHLKRHFKIVVASRSHKPGTKLGGVKFVSNEDALAQKVIIPSIPAQALESFFAENKQHINERALVVDVCSVKANPVKVLQKVLPSSVEILATHPLFGPASSKNGIKGNKIMLHQTRLPDAKYQKIKKFLYKKLGLKIIECTPEEHDKMMAYSQGLSHYIGRAMQEMNIPNTELSTVAYEDLLDMKKVQGGDSWDLFYSIMHENPYALKINQEFKKACVRLDKRIQK